MLAPRAYRRTCFPLHGCPHLLLLLLLSKRTGSRGILPRRCRRLCRRTRSSAHHFRRPSYSLPRPHKLVHKVLKLVLRLVLKLVHMLVHKFVHKLVHKLVHSPRPFPRLPLQP